MATRFGIAKLRERLVTVMISCLRYSRLKHRLTKESCRSVASGAAFSTASQCSPYNSPALIYGIIYGQIIVRVKLFLAMT